MIVLVRVGVFPFETVRVGAAEVMGRVADVCAGPPRVPVGFGVPDAIDFVDETGLVVEVAAGGGRVETTGGSEYKHT